MCPGTLFQKLSGPPRETLDLCIDCVYQYVLPAESTVYLGCVGTDALADQLRAANDREGLTVAYQVLPKGEAPTGACAVVITGHHR